MNKNEINKPAKKSCRRVRVELSNKEHKAFQKRFSLYGTKTEFETITNIPRQTLIKILKEKVGDKNIINEIREYCKEQ